MKKALRWIGIIILGLGLGLFAISVIMWLTGMGSISAFGLIIALISIPFFIFSKEPKDIPANSPINNTNIPN